MAVSGLGEGRKISIEEARRLAKETSAEIVWRPEESLPEEQQYALVYGENQY